MSFIEVNKLFLHEDNFNQIQLSSVNSTIASQSLVKLHLLYYCEIALMHPKAMLSCQP